MHFVLLKVKNTNNNVDDVGRLRDLFNGSTNVPYDVKRANYLDTAYIDPKQYTTLSHKVYKIGPRNNTNN